MKMNMNKTKQIHFTLVLLKGIFAFGQVDFPPPAPAPEFTVILSGTNQVPPNSSSATGAGNFTIQFMEGGVVEFSGKISLSSPASVRMVQRPHSWSRTSGTNSGCSISAPAGFCPAILATATP